MPENRKIQNMATLIPTNGHVNDEDIKEKKEEEVKESRN
ncbi:hypothetical protein BVRB_7g165440 [Beta vulgaris subsp. vulgaris]|nr:hypothetical protein BVRB_7g165440 [Beta vulgaris subsp. vulgaris]